MKKTKILTLFTAMVILLTGCVGERETSSGQTTTYSESVSDSSSSEDDTVSRILSEHPDAEVVTDGDGTVRITYDDGDQVTVTIGSNGSIIGTTHSSHDFHEENFPSYAEVQEKYPDKTVLVWALFGGIFDRYAPFRTREVNEYLDKLGCEYAVCFKILDFEFDGNNYPNPSLAAVNAELDSVEQIDLISPNGNYDEYALNGLYEPLDEYLETDIGRKLYKAFPEKLWESLRINGGIYGLNGTAEFTLSPDWGYFVNAELAEKYNFDVTKPLNEQLDVLRSVRENEKNVDVFAVYFTRLCNILYNSNVKNISTAVYWNSETHSAQCALDDPAYLEKLRLYDDIKKTTVNNKSVLKDIAFGSSKSFFIMEENIAGAGIGYGGVKTVDVDYGENTVTAVPVFGEKTMVRHSPAATGIYSGSSYKEAAFELLARVYTDPALNNLLVYGIEGEDYILEDGTASVLLNGLNFWRFGSVTISHRSEGNPFTPEQYAAIYENAGVYEDVDFVLDPRNIANELNDELAAADALSLSAERSLDDVLSEYRERLYAAGLQTIIDECDRQYEVYKN